MSERARLFQRRGLITRGQGLQTTSTWYRSEDRDRASNPAKDRIKKKTLGSGSMVTDQQMHGMLGNMDLLDKSVSSGCLLETRRAVFCRVRGQKMSPGFRDEDTPIRADSIHKTSALRTSQDCNAFEFSNPIGQNQGAG